MSRELPTESRHPLAIGFAFALAAACALIGAPAPAQAQVFHTGSVTASPSSLTVGDTVTYTVTVTSASATKQIVVGARDGLDSANPLDSANADGLHWTGWNGGTAWVCNPPGLSPAPDPETAVCFFLGGTLPVGQTTPPLTLTYLVNNITSTDCSTSSSGAVTGPCVEMRIVDTGAGPGGALAYLEGSAEFTPVTSGGETRWINAADGDWSDPANWTTGVPGPGVIVDFLTPGTYSIDASGGSAEVLLVGADGVNVTLVNTGLLQLGSNYYGLGIHVSRGRLTLSGSGGRVAVPGVVQVGGFSGDSTLVVDASSLEIGGKLGIGNDSAVFVQNGGSISAQSLEMFPSARIDVLDYGHGAGSVTIGGVVVPSPGTLNLHSASGVNCVKGIIGALAVVNEGFFAVGCSPGTVHVTGDFEQTSTGTLEIELGGPGGGDHLIVDGTAHLGGVLELHGLVPADQLEHQSFQWLEAGATAGDFDEVQNFTGVNLVFDSGTGQVTTGAAHVPLADAGPDQAVDEGTPVTLDGSGSSDPDGDTLTYHWRQVPVPPAYPVTLNLADPVHPTFTAPNVPSGGATLSFELTVDDGALTSDPAVVNVSVKDVNHPPVADAGPDQTVDEETSVNLDAATGSYDPDGDTLGFAWTQTTGSPVSLDDASSPTPTFTAPTVGPAGETLTFEVKVSDGVASATDPVSVHVENVNHPPVADAGADQTRIEGTLVVLDGSASGDPDGDVLAYHWSQQSGPGVVLANADTAAPGFTAPDVGPGGEDLVFALVVDDGLAASPADEVTIHVRNANDPPLCGAAQAFPRELWPPNHKLVGVEIRGVVDPNDDRVTFRATRVTQDEPVNGRADGDTSPDAVLSGDKVLLRAERAGGGDGRVYRVEFTASDGAASCNGAVTVCVPNGCRGKCKDSGQRYDSTVR